MNRNTGAHHEAVEECRTCATPTEHRVSITLVTEGDDGPEVAFSREPYRLRECARCGTVTRQRMNDA